MKIKRFNEARSTVCQTPDTNYHISIDKNIIKCEFTLPFELTLTEEEAKLLEDNIHNSIELVLSRYFK